MQSVFSASSPNKESRRPRKTNQPTSATKQGQGNLSEAEQRALLCVLMCALTVGRQVRQELAESQRQMLELKKTNYALQQQLSMRVGDSWSLSVVQLCNGWN